MARSDLTANEQFAILALPAFPVETRARQDFVPLGEETSYCCFVASGLVARVGQVRDGRRQITAFHVPVDMADLHSTVRPIGTGGLTALTDSLILRVPHTAVREVARRYPAVAEAFWRDSMLDAATLMQWAINVGRRNAQARLAHIFCEMAIRYAGLPREARLQYAFPVLQEHLADATSLTSVHVNRSLRALREEGLVTFKGAQVQIADWQALMRAGEFDPTYLIADTFPDCQKRLIAE